MDFCTFRIAARKALLTAGISCLCCLSVQAQKDWSLRSNKEGIKVFTRTESASGLKEIKVQCAVQATLSQMVALVMDVNAGTDWVYATRSSTLLKRVSASELYYYSEVEMPWPLTNRDFISHLMVSQDPVTRTVIINGPTVPGYVPEKEDIIRVQHSSGKWVLSPAADHSVNIEYTLLVDPGGSIPTWLVNLFATKGPTETFRKLKTQITKPAYARAALPYITN
ncbi:MAG: lipid-binding protein [Chitinophagaceae bacterium]|nr:lipid-binding protein [Chitinophagaceae bacterium]